MEEDDVDGYSVRHPNRTRAKITLSVCVNWLESLRARVDRRRLAPRGTEQPPHSLQCAARAFDDSLSSLQPPSLPWIHPSPGDRTAQIHPFGCHE